MMPFLHGMVTMGFLIAGLFFLRFWRRTKDRLFIVFALAFWLLALNQAFLGFAGDTDPNESWEFLPSLGAFGLLILAILIKNFTGSETGR
jgi:peptidoglycan/LPS O-acetylase OafA/YrhL